jgi:hypothetical protein
MVLNAALHCVLNEKINKHTVHEDPSILFYCGAVELRLSDMNVFSYE